MSGPKIVEIPKEFRSARGTLSLELAEKLNVTGEEQYVEEVMKTRGMDIKNGAVTIVTSVGNGRVHHQRRQLWEHYPPQPADEGGGCRCDTETECRVGEADMDGRRARHEDYRGLAGQLGGGRGHDHRGGGRGEGRGHHQVSP